MRYLSLFSGIEACSVAWKPLGWECVAVAVREDGRVTTEVELLLIRGLPGSGKTTMAKKYAEAGYVHCEADQYFEAGGEYRFDGGKLRAAHDDCLRRAIAALDAGCPVVVANTFTRLWEMEPYLKAAKKRGINARIVEATGNWTNVHGVPADAIERMRARWESVEGEQK